jgi:hypothetical protein
LAKDISTLAAEADMLQPGQRNKFNEDYQSVTAELALLKQMARLLDTFITSEMRQAADRTSLLRDEKPKRRRTR